ncbi:MAG: hypothetical protein E6L00_08400 [Thaumarchaeota archaeon]|nr:MAG: hypothetical protein E6L00_08400 [Nitrososphaerota archaeon]
MSEDPEWRKQYELLLNYISEENHRFWSRFNISILLNGGLIVAFSSLLSFVEKSSLGTFGLFAITILGVIFSYLWYRMTRFANSWSKYQHEKLKNIEKNITENLRIMPFKEKVIEGSVTKTALWHPKIFIIFWCVLLAVIIFLHLKLSTV